MLEIKEEIDTARRILTNRIACRLSIILQRLPSEGDRQQAIRTYIKTHIHDTFITEDNQLHVLINNYHNAMMEAKARHGQPTERLSSRTGGTCNVQNQKSSL